MAPRVSIIVTCYEQGRWIEECLDAIRAQTYTDWELLVVDDVSRDDTADVVRAWFDGPGRTVDGRLLVNPRNLGLPAALNRALERCAGELLAYCGGDDVWHPELLERCVAALDAAGPETALVYADARLVDEVGRELAPSYRARRGMDVAPRGEVFDDLIRQNFLIHSAAVYRRSAVDKVGPWDTDLFFEDWDLYLRLADRYRFGVVDEVLADYRQHDDSMSRRKLSPMLESRLRLLAKWLGRDETTDAHLYPYLQAQSWRLFKVHPDLGREHVAVAYAQHADLVGRLRRLVATSPAAEQGFEVLRRVTRPFRRTEPRAPAA